MRAAGQKEYVNLAKGLITEISPLSFPDGATSNELNFTINKDGLIRERRKGFSYIYPLNTFAGAASKIENLFYWRGSGYAIAILTNDVPETFLRVHAIDENFTAVADSVSLHVRDFELVNDNLTVSETPSSLTDNHEYNLYNAGWFVSKKDENQSGNPLTPTVTTYFNAFSKYPSNADSVGVGMITNSSGVLTFDPDYVRDAGLGNSLSPRGHYVFPIDTYDRTNKLTFPALDGAPSTTLSVLGTITLSGTPSYNPDTPNTGDGGGDTVPFNPYPENNTDGDAFVYPTN